MLPVSSVSVIFNPATRAAKIFIKEVFPQPVGPIIAKSSPDTAFPDTFFKICFFAYTALRKDDWELSFTLTNKLILSHESEILGILSFFCDENAKFLLAVVAPGASCSATLESMTNYTASPQRSPWKFSDEIKLWNVRSFDGKYKQNHGNSGSANINEPTRWLGHTRYHCIDGQSQLWWRRRAQTQIMKRAKDNVLT